MNGIENFMEQLNAGLAKVQKDVADDVIQYYAEYIDDAQKAGLSEEEILLKVGKAEYIVSATLDELAITSAQNSPGPVSLIKTSRRMLKRGVARAVKSTSLAIISLFPLFTAILFYIASATFALAAPASTFLILNSVLTRTSLAAAGVVPLAGIITALFSLSAAVAWGLWIVANGLSHVTLKVFRKIASKAKEGSITLDLPPKKKARFRAAIAIVLVLLFFGGIGMSWSYGLLPRYFALWNSEKPSDILSVNKTYLAQDVKKLTITVLNTNVEILPSEGNELTVQYEKMPYYDFTEGADGGRLSLIEEANGNLPLVEFISAHEGTTKMLVYLPKNMAAPDFVINTNGGDVEVKAQVGSIDITTNSGDITLHSIDGKYNGKLYSVFGKVSVVKD